MGLNRLILTLFLLAYSENTFRRDGIPSAVRYRIVNLNRRNDNNNQINLHQPVNVGV